MLLQDRRLATCRHNPARVDEAVQDFGGRFHEVVLFVGEAAARGSGAGRAARATGREGRGVSVQNQVQRVVVVGDGGAQAGQVEVVLDVVFVDLCGGVGRRGREKEAWKSKNSDACARPPPPLFSPRKRIRCP